MAAEGNSVLESFIADIRRSAEATATFFPFIFGMIGGQVTPTDGEAPPLQQLPSYQIVLINPAILTLLGGETAPISPEQAFLLASRVHSAMGPQPASKASIEALRVAAPGVSDEREDCPVCLDPLFACSVGSKEAEVCLDPLFACSVGNKEAEVAKEMPCGHRYHLACIEKWLCLNGSCPVCRHRMPVEEKYGFDKLEAEANGDPEVNRGRITWVTFGRGLPQTGRWEGNGGQQQQQQMDSNNSAADLD